MFSIDRRINSSELSLDMVLFGVELAVITLSSLLRLTNGEDGFHMCESRNLRATEAFKASRLAATLFPCLVSDVFLKYEPPSSLLLAGVKPMCLITRFCFAMIPTHRIANRKDFKTVSNCYISLMVTLTNMGIFGYFHVPGNVTRVFANGKFMREFYSEVFACFEKDGVEYSHVQPDIAIAMLRWVMDKIF